MSDPTPQEAARQMTSALGVSPIDVARLAEPTPTDQIRHKPGPHSKHCEKPCNVQHRPLDFVDARFVMKRLDEIVGPEFWQSKHTMVGDKVQCAIGIKIDGEWVWKSDGAGETDIEGEKGSFSDALKRAAVSWGIARDLYPEPNQGAQATQRPVQADAGRGAPPPRPAAAAPSVADGAPTCSLHNREMKPSRNGGGWYCSAKAREGEPNKNGWCVERVG